jgi:hypothetical protein
MPKTAYALFWQILASRLDDYGEKLSNVKIFLTTFSPFGGERFPLLSGVALD